MKIKKLLALSTVVALFSACSSNVDDTDNGKMQENTNLFDITDFTNISDNTNSDENEGDDSSLPDKGGKSDKEKKELGLVKIDWKTEPPVKAEQTASSPSPISQNAPDWNKKVNWGIGRWTDENMRPIDPQEANAKYKDLSAVFIGENDKTILLTFDEGYENGYTAVILDSLKEKNVRGIFFVTYDYAKKEPALIRRMIDEGHTVGNHSTTHPSFPELSDAEVKEEIMFLHNYIKDNFGYEMNLIRLPRGEFSANTLKISQNLGYTNVFWSFAHKDWIPESQPSNQDALNNIKEHLHPGEIILLHAVSKTNAEILPELIDFWHSEGYKVTSIVK